MFVWQDCYRGSADLSEALRCLYALPALGVLADPSGGAVADVGASHPAVQLLRKATLPWLFGNTTNGTALGVQGGRLPCGAGQDLPSQHSPFRTASGANQRSVLPWGGHLCACRSWRRWRAEAAAAWVPGPRTAATEPRAPLPLRPRAECRLPFDVHYCCQAALHGALHRRDKVSCDQQPAGYQTLKAHAGRPVSPCKARACTATLCSAVTAAGTAAAAGRPAARRAATPDSLPCPLGCVLCNVCSHVPTLVSNAARMSSWQYQAATDYLQSERTALR